MFWDEDEDEDLGFEKGNYKCRVASTLNDA